MVFYYMSKGFYVNKNSYLIFHKKENGKDGEKRI